MSLTHEKSTPTPIAKFSKTRKSRSDCREAKIIFYMNHDLILPEAGGLISDRALVKKEKE